MIMKKPLKFQPEYFRPVLSMIDPKQYIYLCGPMTGYEDFNRPFLNEAEVWIRSHYEGSSDPLKILNPAWFSTAVGTEDWKACLEYGLKYIRSVPMTFIILHEEAKNSRGCAIEIQLALSKNRRIYDPFKVMKALWLDYAKDEPSKTSVCELADKIVSTERQADYGHPRDNFAMIAALWKAAFGWDVTPQQVGWANVLQKISRELHKPKRDNRVDICGYAKAVDMIEEDA